MLHYARLFLIASLLPLLAGTQPDENEKTQREFIEWAKAQPNTRLSLDDYRSKLVASGLSAAQADERIALIPKLYQTIAEFREQVDTLNYNKLYRAPEQNRFVMAPNAFLVSTIKGLRPGTALDVAMGQGRNAVSVAAQGWDVTGFDIAEEGLKVAGENAAKAGTSIKSVRASFDSFDYGKEKWDLIYFVYTDAPIVEPKYIARIRDALKPGGTLLIDRPFRSLTNPDPGWRESEQDKVNALLKAWADLHIVFYEDTTGIADWQQTRDDRLQHKVRIVRLLARKL